MRRISSGTVTVCVMAIVVGLVAAFVVKQVMAPKPQPVVEAPKEPTIPVVVAIKNLPENHVVRPGDVRVVQIPISRKPKDVTLRLAAIAEGRIVKEAVKAGQTMRDDMLYAIGETLPGLESRIPAGMRALPIHVDEQSVVAKMVNLNSRVDVALTVEGTHPDLGEMATKTLLHNVEVIGVDRTSTTRRAGSNNQGATITVAVSPADANMLINAESAGQLNLSLCSPQNAGEQPVSIGGEDNKITRREILGLSPLPPAPVPPKPYTIETWEGGGRKVITLSSELVDEAQRATANSKKFSGGNTIPVSTEASGVRQNDAKASAAAAAIGDLVPVSTDDRQ